MSLPEQYVGLPSDLAQIPTPAALAHLIEHAEQVQRNFEALARGQGQRFGVSVLTLTWPGGQPNTDFGTIAAGATVLSGAVVSFGVSSTGTPVIGRVVPASNAVAAYTWDGSSPAAAVTVGAFCVWWL